MTDSVEQNNTQNEAKLDASDEAFVKEENAGKEDLDTTGFGEYDNMDKLEVPAYEKKKGIECVNAGKYEEATKHFSKAILSIKYLLQDEKITTQDKFDQLVDEVQIPCHLNNALCFLKIHSWKLAKEHATQALTLMETSAKTDTAKEIKALYRKGMACMHLQEFDEAKECLKRANELDPNNKEVIALMHEMAQRRKQLAEKEKKMSQKLLEGLNYEDMNNNSSESKTTLGNRVKNIGRIVKENVLSPFTKLKEKCCKRKKKDPTSETKKNK